MKKASLTLIICSILSCFKLQAQSVAVLDSGVDIFHPAVASQLLYNHIEIENGLDDDGNGLIDDLSGWNFADNTPQLLNPLLRASWPATAYQYYWIRMKRSFDTWNESEEQWYQEMRADASFMDMRSQFSSYVHGTHVASIALNGPLVIPSSDQDLTIPYDYQIKQLDQFKLLPIRYLGDYNYFPWQQPTPINVPSSMPRQYRLRRYHDFANAYFDWQIGKLERAIAYAASYNQVRVVNGSFGISLTSAQDLIGDHLSKYGLNDEELRHQLAFDFVNELNKSVHALTKKFPHILFTFSAGNSNEDTDLSPHFPSGALSSNVISVGASEAFESRAYFSNFGRKSVDVFAPGLAILSSVSPATEIPINGTSQAAPFVAHLALELFRIYPHANAALAKDIIEKTVDINQDLEKRCSSGGIVNPARAQLAMALIADKVLIEIALKRARDEVSDMARLKVLKDAKQVRSIDVDPLPRTF